MPIMKKPKLDLKKFEGKGPNGMYNEDAAKAERAKDLGAEAAMGNPAANNLMDKMQTIDQNEVLRLGEAELLKMLEEC